MKLFASWSGEDSRIFAEIFRRWLPDVLQETDVWVSSQDIGKGEKWSQSLWDNLSEHDFGIVIVTKTNYASPWILFEAGALSKTVKSRVIPVLCNVERVDLVGSPLSQLQYVTSAKDDIFSLVEAINMQCLRSLPLDRLRLAFEKWWPDFENQYKNIKFQEKTDSKLSGAKADSARLEKIETVLEAMATSIQNLSRKSNSSPKMTLSPIALDLLRRQNKDLEYKLFSNKIRVQSDAGKASSQGPLEVRDHEEEEEDD